MRTKTGTVISAKSKNTVVVRVDRYVAHSKYHKRYRVSSKFHAHDETGAKEGDSVTITETRPLSKLKRWRVITEDTKAAPKTATKKAETPKVAQPVETPTEK